MKERTTASTISRTRQETLKLSQASTTLLLYLLMLLVPPSPMHHDRSHRQCCRCPWNPLPHHVCHRRPPCVGRPSSERLTGVHSKRGIASSLPEAAAAMATTTLPTPAMETRRRSRMNRERKNSAGQAVCLVNDLWFVWTVAGHLFSAGLDSATVCMC